MSPEQLEGAEADARSDLFAFGAVLYEMLTGQHAFNGKSQASLVAAILKEEPRGVSSLAPNAPPGIDRLVQRCLAKEPDDRWHSAIDLGHELRSIADGTSVVGIPAPTRPHFTPATASLTPWIVAGLFAIVAAIFAVLAFMSDTPVEIQSVKFEVAAPEGGFLRTSGNAAGPVAVSPDGRHLVFGTIENEGRNRLWVRSLESTTARPLPGTEGGQRPFWSPDSRFVAFFAGAELKKIEIAGGPALPLCPVSDARGGAWSPKGVLVLAPGYGTGLFRVPEDGGTLEPVTELNVEEKQASHRYPHFLPDGNRFIYLALGGEGRSGTGTEAENHVWAASLDGGEPRMILRGAANAEYADGELVFFRGGALMARPFDPDRLEFTGEVRVLAPEVQYDAAYERAVFSVSSRLLAYRAEGFQGFSTLVRYRPDGTREKDLGPRTIAWSPELSPDGRRMTLAITENDNTDVWLQDVETGRRTRFTFESATERGARWSPDGRRLAYSKSTLEGWDLMLQPASGGGSPEVVIGGSGYSLPVDWTADGGRLVFEDIGSGDTSKIGIVDAKAGSELEWLFERDVDDMRWIRLSPDNRWLSAASNRNGRWDVYLMPFPAGDQRWEVSTDGGFEPIWSVDGKALYYRANNNTITRAEITVRDGVPQVGKIEPLFDVLTGVDFDGTTYDVGADGRIVVATLSEKEARIPLTVVLDWK